MIPDLKNLSFRDSGNFFLIAGPCVVEDDRMPFEIAGTIARIANKYRIPYIFKASYKKANRSRLDSFTGIGDAKALSVIAQVGQKFKIPTLTDIHTKEEAIFAAKFVDIIQIPAFLSRQTELLIAAGSTGKWINIKKGQFSGPESMQFAAEKIYEAGNRQVILTERGTTFGYNDLVIDFRGIPVMQRLKLPVVVDITHSLQQPNQQTGVTGGRPEMIETIARASVAVGADGLFIETHPDPVNAKSDGANMLKLDLLEDLVKKLVKIRQAL